MTKDGEWFEVDVEVAVSCRDFQIAAVEVAKGVAFLLYPGSR